MYFMKIVSLAPEVFVIGDDGLATPVVPEVEGSEAEEAAQSCPVQAIEVE